MPAKFSGPIARARKRMAVRVADIREARCTLTGRRYLSTTACSVPSSSDAQVANVICALAWGPICSLTPKAHTGSSPVASRSASGAVAVAGKASGGDGALSISAAGRLTGWLRPSQRWRSVWMLKAPLAGCESTRKWAACRLRSEGRRGLRSNSSALTSASHSAPTNRLLNAGWASSAW